MSRPTLYIGNKNYSSWSQRPWLAMRVGGIDFEEQLVPFDFENNNVRFAEFSPTKKVPALVHEGQSIWDSLAIMEYVAETYPEANLWPKDPRARAHARSVSAEMHSGFMALREECPFNLHRAPAKPNVSAAVHADVQRIVAIWEDCYERYDGPFLFGHFTIADAMFAPILVRNDVYLLSDADIFQKFGASIRALDAWQEWTAAGLEETWRVDKVEV